MNSIPRYLLMGLTALFLMSCGEEKKEQDPPPPNFCDSISASSSSNPYYVMDLSPPLRGAIFGGHISSVPAQFTLPANTVSFVIQIFGDRALFRNLKNPEGRIVFQARGLGAINPRFRSDLGDQVGYSSNILVPKSPGVCADRGTWTYEVQSASANPEVKLVVRTGNLPARATIAVKPYLTGTTYSVAQIQNALAKLVQVYHPYGIDIVWEPVQSVPGNQYKVVPKSFNHQTTDDLISMGEAGKVNIFFVEDLAPAGRSLGFATVGIAPGIPGSLGVRGQHNGVLVGLTEHAGGGLNTDAVGSTAAHEMGHFLGLFHTTEQSGRKFDILWDTPECHKSPAQANRCPDGGNLMFWTNNAANKSKLSDLQIGVIRRSPIAR